MITGDDETQTAIPEAGYSFSVLKRAQALGDVEALRRTNGASCTSTCRR